MSDYESVNKIKSLQQHIETFTGKSYSDLTSAVQALKNGYGSSEGGGSGIIDVTELPTSGIDENAVYRVTENVQTEKTEVYIKAGSTPITYQQYLTSLGVSTVPNMYVVDELPTDMKVSDAQTLSEIHLYILTTDGIVYGNVPAYGGVITLGLLGFQATGYDKGFTEDINAETEYGVYTTIEAYKQVERWFIRENGEWKEITAYNEVLTSHGLTDKEMLSGDITPRISAAAEIITREITEIKEEWFRKKDGSYYKYIQNYQFCACKGLTNVIIPSYIWVVHQAAFLQCENLKTVTFKSKPSHIATDIFDICHNLTTINVPWSVDDHINQYQPWGATNATINYNYTGE